MKSFADVLHGLIDKVFSGNDAEEAHVIIDGASGTRTPEPEPEPGTETATEPAAEAPSAPTADAPVEEAPPTPGG